MKKTRLGNDIYLIDHFLTEKECDDFIQFSEDVGYEEADVEISSEQRQVLSSVRTNERVNHFSEELAELWWQRIRPLNPPTFEERAAIRLSPHFRFYRYLPGQKFNMHKDGRQTVDGHTSYFTLLAYLNDVASGGETIFRQDDLRVSPKKGQALLFEHQLWHMGSPLIEGVKYVLRTDLVFEG